MNLSYDLYKEGHASLFTARTHDEISNASRDTVENYLENRKIWNEFNYYKQKGIILGKHPIFTWLKRVDQIRGMKISELVMLNKRLEHNLVTNRSAVKKQPNHPETANRIERIKEMEKELSEVNRLLNL